MDPCSQHDPVELPDTVKRPVTALSAVTNLGWGTKGFTPHASGLGCENPAVSDSVSARGDVQWTFFKRFVFEQAFNRNIRAVIGEERTKTRFSVRQHRPF